MTREDRVNEHPVRVLLVEDDVDVAQAITRGLRQSGFEVVSTPNCGAALALTCCFEIGVFDIELCDGDGTVLAAIMRRDQQVLDVVFFTDTRFEPVLDRAQELGPVVRKVEGVEALLAVILGLAGQSGRTVSGIVAAAGQDTMTVPPGERQTG